MMHWYDGLKSLKFEFFRSFANDPYTGCVLFVLVLLVTARDFLLWIFMGNSYLDQE